MRAGWEGVELGMYCWDIEVHVGWIYYTDYIKV